jgi:hypothetical protein
LLISCGVAGPVVPSVAPTIPVPNNESLLPVFVTKKYKKVANRTLPIKGTLPEEFRQVRRHHPDPLGGLPELPIHPPEFTPGLRYTQERHEALKVNPTGFLWPDEEKLAHFTVKVHEDAFAWVETEKGRLKDEWFDPILIPTIEHIPWVMKNIPIPPGIYDRVVEIIRDKMAAGVYEPSNSSYRSRWFCVLKKDGTSLRLVHDLQPLNKVTIQDSSVPPLTEQYAESFAGRACYALLDLFVSFDQRSLDERCRDLTTFQTPLGAKRLTSVPMGYTNATQIMHGDVTHILQDEIPHVTIPFIDDVPVKGPLTRYELQDGGYETIPGNPGIRRFVWEHMNNLNRVLQRMKSYGGTFNGKKLSVCVPDAVIVGHRCTYEGRIPDDSHVQKIRDWPACRSLTEARAFLGTCGVLRIFIRDYAKISRAINLLTRKDVPFEWTEAQDESMGLLKRAILDSPSLRPIDYRCGRPAILAVDSSIYAVGFYLSQIGEDGKRYPSRFGSISWNDRESRYSQAKVELYGLFRALRAYRIWLVGLPRFTVEVDAKYIKGMLNNPDIQPNAAINRWIAAILLFDFDLVHVPGDDHTGADGLSRRPLAEEDPAEPDDFEDWIDDAYSFSVQLMHQCRTDLPSRRCIASSTPPTGATVPVFNLSDPEVALPRTARSDQKENELIAIQAFLEDPHRPPGMDEKEFRRLIRLGSAFFVNNGRLWRRHPQAKHQLVIPRERRFGLIREAHDTLGHKGVFVIRTRLLERFWWPYLDQDVKWYCRTCHECQTRQIRKVLIPPTVATPASLFRRAHMDTMHLPKAHGYHGLVHARCSLSAYPEYRPLRSENARAIAAFIFEDILCRWGALEEIITDNGTPFVKVLDILSGKFGIHHIRISAYNSRANGVIERQHRPVRESLMKAADGIEADWPTVLHSVLWAERVTIQRSTKYSPYRIAHGVEPLFPFDLAEATYLVPPLDSPMSTEDLIAIRARQLHKRQKDLDGIAARVMAARQESVRQFVEANHNKIVDFDFQPGALVLVRNSAVEMELNRKTKPRFFGPMVVVRRNRGGAYILAELDGSLSKLSYAAFRVIPYHARSRCSVPVTTVVRLSEEELDRFVESMDDADLEAGPDAEFPDGDPDGPW